MGDLTGKRIDLTYDGLIKTNDEQPIDGTLKTLQDGVGNDLPIEVSTTGVNFTGTVTGIPGGTDTTYDLDVVDTGDAEIRLIGSDATTDTVNLIAGSNVSLDVSQNNIVINSTGGTDTNTTYDLDFVPDGNNATIELNGSDATTDTISIVPGNNIAFDLGTPGEFTINATGGGTNTTYDFGAIGAAGNINFALSGSDATNDIVTMQAGTNITLTDNGSNNFTIDAAGGGGSAVSSLNLLDGDLTLTAGSGISISDDGNTNITIAATGGGGGGVTAIRVPYVEVTGPSQADEVAFAVLIPANTFAIGDTMQLTGVLDYTNPGGWVYNSLWISTNPTGVGGAQIGAFQTPNGADQDAIPIYKVMTVRTLDGFTACPDQDNLIMNTPGPYVNPVNIDWSVDQYLKWTYFIDNAASSLRIQGLALTKLS